MGKIEECVYYRIRRSVTNSVSYGDTTARDTAYGWWLLRKKGLSTGFLFTGPGWHWHRQLWGTGPRAPLDFQLVILVTTRFTDSDESCAWFSVQ